MATVGVKGLTWYCITADRCDVKLPLGAECHDNDQCESEYCDIHWYNDIVMGHGGRCANR